MTKMDIQTQSFLRNLGGYKGVTYRELKSLDRDGDGRLSDAETSNRINTQDLKAINLRLQVYRETLEPLPFIDDDSVAFSGAELNSTLFPNGVAGINPNDVQQGDLGDCYFLATLASLAASRPQDIVSMIGDKGNGSYSVKFPGAKYAVTVSDSDQSWAGAGYNRQNQSTGSSWVSILEKAFVKYVMKENTGTAKTAVSNTANTLLGIVSPGAWLAKKALEKVAPAKKDPQEYFKWGGLQDQGIRILTNHSTDDDVLALTSHSTLRGKIKSHLASGDLITASTFKAGSDSHHLDSDHVYSVLAYDEREDAITLRNPHGYGSDATGLSRSDSQNDGIFKMSVAEFNKYFTFIGYENR